MFLFLFVVRPTSFPNAFRPTLLSSTNWVSLAQVKILKKVMKMHFSGDPDDLVNTGGKTTALEDWRDFNSLTLLNLSYDVTPANLVDAIISEISVIPGTSVPVVLRLKNMDQPQ